MLKMQKTTRQEVDGTPKSSFEAVKCGVRNESIAFAKETEKAVEEKRMFFYRNKTMEKYIDRGFPVENRKQALRL